MSLEIAFSEKALRQICESEKKAKLALGPEKAIKLMRRLADLRAASNMLDLIVGNPRELSGVCPRSFAIDVYEGAYMVLDANHNKNPVFESGCIDWTKVNRIKILRIEKHHA